MGLHSPSRHTLTMMDREIYPLFPCPFPIP
nr:MAG TPA: hypothetical protein [Caudoviricetes sp.]